MYILILKAEKHGTEKYLLNPPSGKELLGQDSLTTQLTLYKPEMGSELHVGT